MIEGNSEIKNVLNRRRWEFTLGKPVLPKEKAKSGRKQEYTFTRTPCYPWVKCTVEKMQSKRGMIKCQL